MKLLNITQMYCTNYQNMNIDNFYKYQNFNHYLDNLRIKYTLEYKYSNLFKKGEYKHLFRCDYAFFKNKLTYKDNILIPDLFLEIEGGTFAAGRHSRGKGFHNDTLKYNTLSLLNLPLIRFTSEIIINYPVDCAELIYKFLNNSLYVTDINKFIIKHKKK